MNIFAGRTEAWLETELARLQREYTSLVTSASAGDSSTSKHRNVSEIERRIEKVLRALHALNPTDYPFEDIRRVSVTKAYFPSST